MVKSFNNGSIIPVKMRHCGECKCEILCMTCKNQGNENKEFEANLSKIKGHASDQFGYMLPYYKP